MEDQAFFPHFGSVSVIISSFNKGQYIRETVASVCSQSYDKFETIIVDDCSTDDTWLILKDLVTTHENIKIFRNDQNRGANYCRNFGFEQSEGDYIIFLDGDDLLAPNCLSGRMEEMRRDPGNDFAVFSMGVFRTVIGDSTGGWIPRTKNALGDFLRHRLPWALPQPIWRREFLTAVGGFDESFMRLQDVELHTRVLFRKEVRFLLIGGRPDCFYRIAEQRVGFKKDEMLMRVVQSCRQYYSKFFDMAAVRGLEGKLMGTVYAIYLSLINSYKGREISEDDFRRLERDLLDVDYLFGFTAVEKFLFSLGKLVCLSPFQVKGVNWMISRALTWRRY